MAHTKKSGEESGLHTLLATEKLENRKNASDTFGSDKEGQASVDLPWIKSTQ